MNQTAAELDRLFAVEEFARANITPDSPRLEHLAWAAGFWDGEGYVGAGGNTQGYRMIRASITQKDRRALERFQAVTELGKIYPRRADGQWAWQVASLREIRLLASLLWPWLGEIKRDQFIYAFGTHELLKRRR